jgi:hypothetical protein
VPPTTRVVPRFAAEPPQDEPPSGAWAQRLREEFLAACLALDADGEPVGEPGDIAWFPDRTWHGHTFVPATAPTSEGLELLGYVSYPTPAEGDEPTELRAVADFTAETAAANPDWRIDLSDEVIGTWRGEDHAAAAMTLVWGRPLIDRAVVATAELGGVTVDQCPVLDGRFTLVAPDDYRGATLTVKLFDADGEELAGESLYDEDDE